MIIVATRYCLAAGCRGLASAKECDEGHALSVADHFDPLLPALLA